MSKKVTDSDIKKYYPMVEMYLKKYVIKNWNEAQMGSDNGEISLGNTGMAMNDIRQYLLMQVCIGLQKYNPNFRTKEGKTVKESTFIYQHLFNRIGQLMKKLTKKRYGYGLWTQQIEKVLWEIDED